MNPPLIHCQQDELYAAESKVARGGASVPPGQLQAWVDELRDLPYWLRNFPNVLRIECHVRKSNRAGSVGGFFPEEKVGQIEMAPVHLTEVYVLHEVAHVLAHARYGSHAHDPWFTRTYLELVAARLGSATYQELAEVFDRAGIDYAGDFSNPGGIPLGGTS